MSTTSTDTIAPGTVIVQPGADPITSSEPAVAAPDPETRVIPNKARAGMLRACRGYMEQAWSAETSAGGYEPQRPSSGQSAVTALVVQDLLGGEIVRVENGGRSHYYNVVGDGEIDLTRDQFDVWVPHGPAEPRRRDQLLSNASTLYRYELLRDRFRAAAIASPPPPTDED